MKEPAGSCVSRQILIGEMTLPPGGILNRLEFCRDQPIGILLRHTLPVQRCIAFILEAPVDVAKYTGEGIGSIPLAQLNPSIRAI